MKKYYDLIHLTLDIWHVPFDMAKFNLIFSDGFCRYLTDNICSNPKTLVSDWVTDCTIWILGYLSVRLIEYMGGLGRIPHICHFWYATIFLGLWKVRQKVRKFATKIAPQQNSVNWYFEIPIHILQIISICGIFCVLFWLR